VEGCVEEEQVLGICGLAQIKKGQVPQFEAIYEVDLHPTAGGFTGTHQNGSKSPGCALPVTDQDLAA